VRPELTLSLTVDVGPADAVLDHRHERGGDWARTEAGVAVLCDTLADFADEAGLRVAATWFVRADAFIAAQFGDPLAMVHRFADLLRARLDAGDELGWMPQVYSADTGGIDYAGLEATHCAFAAAHGAPASVRMGGLFHDDRTMAMLDALGVRFDSSALPGREKTDRGWRVDWRRAPATPYHPDRGDYQRPGADPLRVLEVPLSMLPIAAPYDLHPLPRYFDPTFHPSLLAPELRSLAVPGLRVAVLHPDAVLPPPPGGGHPLVGYSPQALTTNLRAFRALAAQAGCPLRMPTLAAAASALAPA
jgi:hypothetical protein